MKNLLLLSIPALFLSACSSKQEFVLPDTPQIIGLASPFVLPADTGTLQLQDYIVDLSQLDSVSSVEGLQLDLQANKDILKIKVIGKPQPVSILHVWCKGTNYAIPLKRSVKQVVEFNFPSNGVAYDSVQLAGDINNWRPSKTPLTLQGDKWTCSLTLNPGRYPYQVVLNGSWRVDPNNPDSTSNGMGGFNSILKVEAPASDKLPVLYTESHNQEMINVSAENGVKNWVVIWENYELPQKFLSTEGQKLQIKLPAVAAKLDKSSLRIWAFNEFGAGNDILIPLINGKVADKTSDLGRSDFHTSVLYFMLVDRFANGDSLNDQPVDDKRIDFKANYQGGDLAGVAQKIQSGYFEDLGVNTLWFSPIVQNPLGAWQEYPQPRRWFSGYHGYWPVFETKVDTRFGTDNILSGLVESAHAKNMNVVMDFVSNHIHKENPLYKQHPDWFSSMYLPNGTVNIRIWDEQRLTTWFDDFMPDIDYTKPEAVNAFSDSALYWLKKFKLDGFRHDATKHVSETFWRALTRKIKQEVVRPENRNVYQIGETFGSRELINSYIGSGMMDAQFDFNLYFDARPVFASEDESFEKVAASLSESALYYGSHSLMGNITGNHDMPRFLYYAGGSARPGEDEKEAGWSRDIQVEDVRGYARLKMLHAFIQTIPGIPIMYYGDEIGMPGANDPDNRRMMRFDGLSPEEQDVKTCVTKLCNYRKASMALCYGDTRVVQADKDVFIYTRQYFNKTAIILMNRSSEPKLLKVNLPTYMNSSGLAALFQTEITTKGGMLILELPPLSFEIVSNDQP